MGQWKVAVAVLVYVVWICALFPRGWAVRQWRNPTSIAAPPDADNDVITEHLQNSAIFLVEDMPTDSSGVNLKVMSSTDSSVQKYTDALPSQTRHTFLDSLTKENFQFLISGDEHTSKSWFTQYLKSLLGWIPISRRNLADQSFPTMLADPASALAPVVEPPTYTPEPSPDPTSTISPAPNGSPAAETPHSVSTPEPNDLSFQPSAGPGFAPALLSNQNGAIKRAVTIAVIATAAGTFLSIAILYYCYKKCCRNISEDELRGERPLITLSISDFPLGSSPKSFALENSIDKEKLETLPIKSYPSQNGRVSSVEISSVKLVSNIPKPLVDKETQSLEAVSDVFSFVTEPSTTSSNANAPVPPTPSIRPPIMASSPLYQPPPPPPPPPPPTPTGMKPGPHPAPPPPPVSTGIKSSHLLPPKSAFPPPRPPQLGLVSSRVAQSSPVVPHNSRTSGEDIGTGVEAKAPKAKLKPLFWDKILANPDHSMVWHQIRSGSFQFNEEMIASLFGYSSTNKPKGDCKKELPSNDSPRHYVQILDPKKEQNLSILLRALNVTKEEVCDALQEGTELPTELLQTLLKMAPSRDEEQKLQLYRGQLSQLGRAEMFLKSLVDIPFAYKRMDALVFMGSLQEEVSSIKESFATIEAACKELRSSSLFLKLLEAVLKTGNRMNDGTFRGGAQAFRLDTLLKLADVKGADGKTTLLHFVIQEIIRSEGIHAAHGARESESISVMNSNELVAASSQEMSDHYFSLGLQVITGLDGEFEYVKKAAVLDFDALTGTVANLGHGLVKMKEFLESDMQHVDQGNGFRQTLKSFVEHADVDITWLLGEEKRIQILVKNTTDYFHGNTAKDEGLRLFVIVRDFLCMLDKACKEVKEASRKAPTTPSNKVALISPPILSN